MGCTTGVSPEYVHAHSRASSVKSVDETHSYALQILMRIIFTLQMILITLRVCVAIRVRTKQADNGIDSVGY